MVIGADALAFHGAPRAPGDMDLFVRSRVDNSPRIHRSLVEFGAPVAGLDLDDLATPGHCFQIGVAPCRIDIRNQIDGVDYDKPGFEIAELAGLRFKIISRADFILNKLAAGRPTDLADIERLEQGA